MSTSLAALRRSTPSSSTQQPAAPTRSSSFTHRAQHQRPQARQGSTELEVEDRKTVTRDEDSLAIIENLLPGPRNFERDPEGEEEWVHLEPNSAIRLS